MPPKKDNKKEAPAKPDNSGIPKRDIDFKFNFSLRSESPEPPQLALMFQWFAGISDKFERNETPLIQSWKKEQQEYVFEKECDPIRVDDDFCKSLSNKSFFLYFVNGEDSKVQDQLLLDYSSLLTANDPPSFRFESNIIRALGVDHFSITLTASKPLLEDVYRHYLNPLEVQVIGAKDLPVEKSSRYEPTYVKLSFFDGSLAQTPSLVGGDKLLWSHKHVFLAGLMNPVELKQKMRSKYLKFQLHDRDEIVNRKAKPDVQLFDIAKALQDELEKEKPVEEDPKKKGAKKEDKKEPKKDVKKDPKKKDAKLSDPVFPEQLEYQRNNYGVAAFSLVQFLKATTRSARYKAPVVPRNAYEDLQSRNLDLNTTARNEMQGKIISSNNYFDCDTVLVVGFSLAHSIGTFVAPEPQTEVVEDPKKKKEAKEVVPDNKQPVGQKQSKPGDVFERIVYLVPYKNAEMVKKIEDIFYDANLKSKGFKNKRQISTYLLTGEQQQSLSLDYVTGLQICDPEGRLYILEGLREGAMKNFSKEIIRQGPNSKEFKILKNSNVKYSHRLFSAFHLELKRIRLRPNLNQLLLSPSIYIKSKVPEELSRTLVHLADARKVPDSLISFESLNLWPDSESLLQIQRKFSQPLSNEDLTGTELPPKNATTLLGQTSKPIRLVENTELNYVPADEFFQPKAPEMQVTGTIESPENTHKKLVMTKTFTKDNFNKPETYTMRGRVAELPPGQEVYIYGGQKLNFYEQQMADFRNKMDPKTIYTYGKDHFTLAIDPRTEEEEAKKQMTQSLSMMYSKDKFSSLIVKTKEERLAIPKKPGEQDILDMINYPYHEQLNRQKEMMKNTRDQPVSAEHQFKKYLRPQEVFSTFVPIQGEKLTPVEQERIEREKKAKEKELERSMMKGNQVMKFKRGYSGEHTYGIDRFKDIRDGDSKKLGLIDKHKKDGQRRQIDTYQVSYNLKEKTGDPAFNPLIRIDDSKHNLIKDEFNFYQRPQVLTRTQIYKPLKDII